MRYFYTALFVFLTPFYLLRLYWRGLQSPAYRERWLERFGVIEPPGQTQGIWVHAVSVGEVLAIEQFVKRLRLRFPDLPILITTTTPTGAERVSCLFGNEVSHRYAPIDLPWTVRRFLTRFRPRLLVLVETEIWPNLIHYANRAEVPVLLANARLSARSAQRYRRLAQLTRSALRQISLIAPQAESDAERFIALGAQRTRVDVTGSIKYDVHLPGSLRERADVMRREWGAARPVWLAASTHEGEDEIVLEAHSEVLKQHPDALLVLVPRHPERFDRVASLVQAKGFSLCRRSEGSVQASSSEVFLGDTMGELTLFIGASDLAFIGGSLVPHGGHNMLEAAAQGVAVVFGPHMFNFADISELFLQQNAAVQVDSGAALSGQVCLWLSNATERSRFGEAGRSLVERNRGALDRLLHLAEELIKPV